jgi:hypothetical protein
MAARLKVENAPCILVQELAEAFAIRASET